MTEAKTNASARIPRPTADVATEVIDDEVLLYQPQHTRAIYLNATAAVIWGLVDGRRTVDDIVTLIDGRYPDAGADVVADVCATLAQLQENGLLVLD
jgi:hypothetical protein